MSTDPKPPETSQPCQYFVDEAGDAVLFGKRGRVVVGTQGCSRFFILGLLQVDDPALLQAELDSLRAELLADSYYSNIPSMRPEACKTAISFHAKDDIPEVRRDVFKTLLQHKLKFFALVRDKQVIASICKNHPKYRYRENDLYDKCTSRLFKERLHKEESYAIHFSARGNKPRTEALQQALEQSRNNMRRSWNVDVARPIEIVVAKPATTAGLQAVDYFLWALQRLYERGESRYWDFIAEKVSMVHDVDDKRQADYGVYYSGKSGKLPTAESIRRDA
jgi:hypothetical protein